MAIHIKKIDSFTSFCGIDNVTQNDDFTDYNVIFANNGAGKTSTTRAFELLIQKNNHIAKYQTIDSSTKPKVSFQLQDTSTVVIDETHPTSNQSFKLEIYNSDFLSNNAPFGTEFGLRKLDDQTIVLEGSTVGEETKEIEQLNTDISNLREKQIEINGNPNNPDEIGKIKTKELENANIDKKLEFLRKEVTSTPIQITIDEILIKDIVDVEKASIQYDQKALEATQDLFDSLNEAIKRFDTLTEIVLPTLNFDTKKIIFEALFEFDIEKEAGEVSEKINAHILQVGKDFLTDGRQIINDNNLEICPFCTQVIPDNILTEYANYFNEAVNKFDSQTAQMMKALEEDQSTIYREKANIFARFDQFKPFIKENFDEYKTSLMNLIELVKDKLDEIKILISEKNGIGGKVKYAQLVEEITGLFSEIAKIIQVTNNILEDKKAQTVHLSTIKSELKALKISKAKKDSFDLQKSKYYNTQEMASLQHELKNTGEQIKSLETKLTEVQSKRRPDIQVINAYLKALNLPKYTVNQNYQINCNTSIVENENLKIVLSEGEKTTITFAYFLARLKLFYDKTTLKNLVIVMDDPISSLDESRIYNTSYLVAKINQEIAGEILKDNKDKAQVFVLTHNHTFMTNIIRILEQVPSYFQIKRIDSSLIFDKKNKAAGYFDTFFLLLFKEIYQFTNELIATDDYNQAINHGNKIRILLESFMKTNFISEFIKQAYKDQSVFDETTIQTITTKIKQSNSNHIFSNSIYAETEFVINSESDIYPKINKILKGLHMDSHGSIVDFYSQHKTSLIEVQGFAKIAINIMMALNPNQVYFYIEASK